MSLFEIRKHRNNLIRFTTIAENYDDVFRSDYPDSAVQCVGGVKKDSGGPGARHCRGNLLRDDTGFTNSNQDNLAFAGDQ
jgi:hypothetical protein